MILSFYQRSYAETGSDCKVINDEITNYEKEFLLNSQLLTTRKQEMEKLSPKATSIKMKLTADIFMIAAKKEAAQNWLKVKRNEKSTKCPIPKHH
jgi:hypothetical protein